MRRVQYGNKNRPVNTYQEVRDAVLYKRKSEILLYAETDPDTLMKVACEGDKIDPSYIAELCPQYLSTIEDQIINDPSVQTPEIIIKIAKHPNARVKELLGAFLSSCSIYSYQAVLEGLDVFDPQTLETWLVENCISVGNCKNLRDFAKYSPTFEKDKYLKIFLSKSDLVSVFKLANDGLFSVQEVDDMIFNETYASYQLISDKTRQATEDDHSNYSHNINNLFLMAEEMQTSINLDRIEDFLIEEDNENNMYMWVNIFNDRPKVSDYLSVKEIMG